MKPICTKPWTRLYVTADGKCWNCCYQKQPFHIVGDGATFEDAWNNKNIREIRTALLRGEMPESFCDCLNKRGSIPPPDDETTEPFRTPVQIPPSKLVQINIASKKPFTLDDIPTDDHYFRTAKVRLFKSIQHISPFCKLGDKVLDVGGGENFGKLISKLDIDYEYVNGSHLDLRVAKLKYPDDYFDVVLCWETIEHMWQINRDGNLDWDGVINCWNECFRVLKPGGYFSLTTTNRVCPRTFRTIQQGLCQQIFPAVCTANQMREGHAREFSGDEILLLMEHGGSRYIDCNIGSDDCYPHVYDMPADSEMYLRWKTSFETFLGRPLKGYEMHDTLFFSGRKPYNTSDEFITGSKSLLIVGSGRSASTVLQALCSDMLGYRNVNEIFNSTVYEDLLQRKVSFIPELPFFAPRRFWPEMWKLLVRYGRDCVVKDLLQPEFVFRTIDQILHTFNVLYIRRNTEDVIKCHHHMGWPFDHVQRVHGIYDNLFAQPQEGMAVLRYDDFINDESVLNNIIRKWYPSSKWQHYITEEFVTKRNSVAAFLKQYKM